MVCKFLGGKTRSAKIQEICSISQASRQAPFDAFTVERNRAPIRDDKMRTAWETRGMYERGRALVFACAALQGVHCVILLISCPVQALLRGIIFCRRQRKVPGSRSWLYYKVKVTEMQGPWRFPSPLAKPASYETSETIRKFLMPFDARAWARGKVAGAVS